MATPAEQFTRWRRATKVCLVVGAALSIAAQSPPAADWPIVARVTLVIGVTLLLATFPLYYRFANRCPRCGRSFSDAPEYKSSETDGLPLASSIDSCPFCAERLKPVSN